MRLDLSPLEKSLSRLNASISYLRSCAPEDAELRIQFQQSVIQAFEFTYGVAVAMIDRALAEIARDSDSLRDMDFPDRMREAARNGLIRDPRDFLEYRRKRNLTSHAYNEELADSVLSGVDDFAADAEFLLARLREQNQ